MAVVLSNSLWLMNNNIRQIIEGSKNKYHLKEKDRKELEALRKEYYELTEDSYFRSNPKGFVKGPGVEIRGLVEQVEVSKDENRNYTLFKEVANILKRYLVEADVYRRLGRVFKEIGKAPEDDTIKAIKYANIIVASTRFGSLDRICWENEKKLQSQKIQKLIT